MGALGSLGSGHVGRHVDPPNARSAASWATASWGDIYNGKYYTSTGWQTAQDPGSLYAVENTIGARSAWSATDSSGRPITGKGIAVALLDSGTASVPGLDGTGKLTLGPDLSIEQNTSDAQKDTFGHGTFMAGIIAGRGSTAASNTLASQPATTQLGIAPDADVLSMKLATADGSTDVSEVIAALDWVTQHSTLPSGERVRVINLSYGTESTQPYGADPLAAAAENAWRHGIVVVVSAGNDGAQARGMTDPAIDPYVLSVGASTSQDVTSGWAPGFAYTQQVADYSSVGNSTRHPDIVAPGTSIVSLRDPGSYIDTNFSTGRVPGNANLFRGSGTSQATAVVSGAAALLLQAYPTLTPDQVKKALVASATPIRGASVNAAGAGVINIKNALTVAREFASSASVAALRYGAAAQTFPISTGQGSLQAARGGDVLTDANGNTLSGEYDVQGNAWNPASWWAATSTLSSWSGGSWLGTTYTGSDWSASSGPRTWKTAPWTSALWSGIDWSGHRWSGHRWSGHRWS